MKHLLIILSILLLSSHVIGQSKEIGLLFFRYGNEDVGWYEDDDGSKYGKWETESCEDSLNPVYQILLLVSIW